MVLLHEFDVALRTTRKLLNLQPILLEVIQGGVIWLANVEVGGCQGCEILKYR